MAKRKDAEDWLEGAVRMERSQRQPDHGQLQHADLADRERNGIEGFEPDAYMRLPVDADGVPIRLGDTVWHVGGGIGIPKDSPLKVTGFVMMHGVPGAFIETRELPAAVIKPKWLTHRQPEPPDSWEKLEEDAKKTVCEYAGAPLDESGLTTCEGCRFHRYKKCYREMTLDVFARAKKLAGIEEQEGK